MIHSSHALTDPTSCRTRTARHTSNCACSLPKSKPHTRCVFQYNSHQKTAASTANSYPHTASATNRQVRLRQALSALNAKTPSQKSATQNLESLPKSQYIGSQTQPIPLHERPLLLRLQPQRLERFAQHGRRVIERARHRFPGALRLLQSFPGLLDNGLVAACSPLDSRDAPVWCSPWFSNCWKTLRNSPVISSLSSA